MIASLRRIHRVAAPAAFALAGLGLVVATRGASAPPDESRQVDVSGMELTTSADGRFRIGKQVAGARGSGYLWLLPNEPLDAPDLLVYAIDPAYVGGAGTDLPNGAQLLGPADSTEASWTAISVWPEAVALYSMGHASVVATVKLGTGEGR